MNKRTLLVILSFLIVIFSHAQKPDSAALAQKEANAFIDSITTNTSIGDFQKWVDESVSGKMGREGKFSELYQLFLQNNYSLWLQKKAQSKSKPK